MTRPWVRYRIAVVLAAMACAGSTSQRVLVPPQLDLVPYGSVGVVTFTVENGKGGLSAFVTQRFEEYVLAAQKGIEVQEFTTADSGAALGGARGVPVVFLGHLKVSRVKPRGGAVGTDCGARTGDGLRGIVSGAALHQDRRRPVAQQRGGHRAGR